MPYGDETLELDGWEQVTVAHTLGLAGRITSPASNESTLEAETEKDSALACPGRTEDDPGSPPRCRKGKPPSAGGRSRGTLRPVPPGLQGHCWISPAPDARPEGFSGIACEVAPGSWSACSEARGERRHQPLARLWLPEPFPSAPGVAEIQNFPSAVFLPSPDAPGCGGRVASASRAAAEVPGLCRAARNSQTDLRRLARDSAAPPGGHRRALRKSFSCQLSRVRLFR